MTHPLRLVPAPEPWLTTSPAGASATADHGNWFERSIDNVTSWTDVIGPRTWALLAGLTFLALVVSLPIARRQAFIAGRVAAGKAGVGNKDRALFIASMIPTALFWIAVMAGSFRGLIAFGRDTLHWSGGWELLVPFTLDGISVAFGFLAFRAVQKRRSPDRANNMVKAASVASALINYVHEVGLPDGVWLGGMYLALLSILGIAIFHEILEQFVDGTEYIQRVRPKFGLRWITYTPNTVCAFLAWQNHPPQPLRADATKDEQRYWGSVLHAVAHLEDVRTMKRQRQRERDLDMAERGFRWWHWIAFPVRFRQLDATVAKLKAEHEREMEAAVAEVIAEAERIKADALLVEQKLERAEQMAEQIRTGAVAKLERLQMEHQRELERVELEHRREVERLQMEQARQLQKLSTDQTQQIGTVLAEQDQRAERARLEQVRQVQARMELEHRREVERLQVEHAEQVEQLQVEHRREVEQLQVEVEQAKVERAKVEHANRSGSNRSTPSRSSSTKVTPLSGRRVDEDADNASLADMFGRHPESSYEWGTREIRDITGAGFSGRGPRLLAKATEHIANCSKKLHNTCFTEQAKDGHSDVTSANTPDSELVAAGS